jgi:uncharacterized membrane protein (UPF0127 family)
MTNLRAGPFGLLAAGLVTTLLLGGCGESLAESVDAPPSTSDESALPAPATAWVIFGADTVVAEVARTPEERNQGLMYRESLGEDAGMIFIFPDNAVRSFWMQNTYIALDIAFMAPDLRIVDIQQMDPMTTDSHTSRGPAMYALEVNQGWFAAHGVQVGDTPQVIFGS